LTVFYNDCAVQAYPLSDHDQEMPGERASFNFKVPGKAIRKEIIKTYNK